MLTIAVIKDVKANVYNKPFACENIIECERIMRKLINDKDSFLNEYPEDFVMCAIGQFDKETGELKVIKEIQVVSGSQIVDSKKAFLRQKEGDEKLKGIEVDIRTPEEINREENKYGKKN
jgi:hypothetical protein